jgi:hypothetical protein
MNPKLPITSTGFFWNNNKGAEVEFNTGDFFEITGVFYNSRAKSGIALRTTRIQEGVCASHFFQKQSELKLLERKFELSEEEALKWLFNFSRARTLNLI